MPCKDMTKGGKKPSVSYGGKMGGKRRLRG